MNENLHDIDDLFKNSIDGHLEEVPSDVWKNIDHSLDKKQAAFYKRRYFVVRAAAILLILIGGVTIAAILHFQQHEKVLPGRSADQNVVTTSNGNTNNRSANNSAVKSSSGKEVNDLTEKKQEDEKSIVLNTAPDNHKKNSLPNGNTITVKRKNSKEYQSTSSDMYSAQESEEISRAISKRDKLNKQKETIKNKLVTKSSVDLVATSQNNSREKTEQQKDVVTKPTSAEKTLAAPGIRRTSHVEGNLLNANTIRLSNTLPQVDLNNSIVSSLVLNSSLPVAQKTRAKNNSQSWSISPMYAQNINLNTLKDDDHFRDPRNNSREVKNTEQKTVSFTTGLGVQKQISRNISLQTGVQYFSSQTNIQPKIIFAKQDAQGDVRFQFHCSSGDSYFGTKNGAAPSIGDSIKTNFSKSRLSYLQVPLLLSYKINFGRFSFLPSAGFQTNVLLSGKLNSSLTQTYGDEEVTSSIDGLRSMYLSGVFQPQFNYQLNDRISFDFNPNINFSLTPINKETAVQTYQNMISIGAGLRIKL